MDHRALDPPELHTHTFGEQAWAQAQDILARRGGDPATETDIAAAVAALLDKAEQGPDPANTPPKTKRDRRVAARTRATTEQPTWPGPCDAAGADRENTPDDADATDQPTPDAGLAPVIPLGIFDAHAEAQKWW